MLDTGVFVALGKPGRIIAEILRGLALSETLAVVATSVGEFWRGPSTVESARFGQLRPFVLEVDLTLAKRAGELLARSGHDDLLDALVVAGAERLNASSIYTSDPLDMEMLLAHSDAIDCLVIAV